MRREFFHSPSRHELYFLKKNHFGFRWKRKSISLQFLIPGLECVERVSDKSKHTLSSIGKILEELLILTEWERPFLTKLRLNSTILSSRSTFLYAAHTRIHTRRHTIIIHIRGDVRREKDRFSFSLIRSISKLLASLLTANNYDDLSTHFAWRRAVLQFFFYYYHYFILYVRYYYLLSVYLLFINAETLIWHMREDTSRFAVFLFFFSCCWIY